MREYCDKGVDWKHPCPKSQEKKGSLTSSLVAEKKEVQDMSSSYLPIIILILGVQSRPQGSHEGQEQSRVAEVMASLGDAVKGAVCKVLQIFLQYYIS